MKSKSILNRLRNDRKGSVAIIFTFAMLPMVFAAGSAIDYGRAHKAKATLQAATDSAALGASAILGGNQAKREEKALQLVSANLPADMKGTGQWVKLPPAADAPPSDPTKYKLGELLKLEIKSTLEYVSVEASFATPTTLMRIAHIEKITSAAKSKVLIDTTVTDGSVCLLALNSTSNVSGIAMGGNSTIADQGCWAWSNSTSVSLSMNAWGSSDATAAGFCSAGGVSGSSRFVPTPLTQCAQQPDPFASLPMPSFGGCDYNGSGSGDNANPYEFKNETTTVAANPSGVTTFCGGLTIKNATVTFPAGIYVIKDGDFEIQASGATAQGQGVVFLFSGAKSRLYLRGGGNAILKAPTVAQAAAKAVLAPYAGMLFVDDRNNKPTAIPDIRGGGSVKMEGILYAPTRAIYIGGNGNVNQQSAYWSMIADSFYLNGTGDLFMKTDFATAGFPDILPKVKRLTRITHSQ